MTYDRTDIYVNNPVVVEEPAFGHGPIVVRRETNDNNDDGYEDLEVEVWFMRFKTLEDAYLHICGGLKNRTPSSHRGYYGQPVDIYQDGVRL